MVEVERLGPDVSNIRPKGQNRPTKGSDLAQWTGL